MHKYRNSRSAVFILLTAALTGVLPLAAQNQQSGGSDLTSSKPFFDRLSFGVRGGIMFNNLLNSRTDVQSTSEPPLTTTTFSNSAAKRYAVGPTVGFDISDRLLLSVDFLYRRSGYDSGTIWSTQLTEDQDEDDYEAWGEFERTRADYWDIPILARLYHRAPEDEGMRAFVTGGFAIRTVNALESFHEAIGTEGLSDTNTFATDPANSTIPGAVVGAGLRFSDEMSLKVDMEVRFTRWFKRTFDAPPTRSSLNQAEFILSFTF